MARRDLSEADFLSLRARDYRVAWLTHDIDVSSAEVGLEIGALDNPTPLPSALAVEYVDYAPTEALQAHPHEDTVRRSEIVRVDHVWPGSGSLADVCRRADFQFAIASHVIEHVPNVLGWFQGIHGALRPGGVFNLAIPDCRYTFDIRRKPSTLGEMVEAFLHGYTHPSVRQVFDHTYDASDVAPGAPWSPDFDLRRTRRYSGDQALALAFSQSRNVAAGGRYYDSHCWVFTPDTFLSLIEGATELGLFPFIISNMAPTQRGAFEFFVSFRKADPATAPGLQAIQVAALRHIRHTHFAA